MPENLMKNTESGQFLYPLSGNYKKTKNIRSSGKSIYKCLYYISDDGVVLLDNLRFEGQTKLSELKSKKPIRLYPWRVEDKSIKGSHLRIFDNRDHPKYPQSHIYLKNITEWKYSSLVKLIDMINNNYSAFNKSIRYKHKKKSDGESKKIDAEPDTEPDMTCCRT